MSDISAKPSVLTCAQPSNQLHLGNYLGAIRQWVSMQEECECYFGVVDLHAMTLPYVPADLRKNTLECVIQYMACGIDPEQSNIFIQSHIPEHTELSWILGCLTPIGQLERMTQFKDKSQRAGESVGSGLLFYPVLMAADILLYNADRVPVGNDQKQHLELARDLAAKFNHTYSDTFKLPEPYILKNAARIMSLQSPENKMSKSDKNENATIFLFEPIDKIRKKIMSAVTDSDAHVSYSDEKAGIKNLLEILHSLTGKPINTLVENFKGQGYAPFKREVADQVIAFVEPLQAKYNELKKNKDYIEQVIAKGDLAAKKRAQKMLSKVKRKVGLVPAPRLDR